MEASPQASVVIPTHGRRDSLLRVLRALTRQSVPADTFEVVVICDGDVDGSAEACRTLAPTLLYALRVVEQFNAGPAEARNRGVAEARAALIIFTDDDVMPDERFIEAHLEAQTGQSMRVTIGPLLPPPDVRLNAWGAWEEDVLCRQYEHMMAGKWRPSYRQFYTGNASVLKHHILDTGGFNAAFRRAEDVELGLRLHFRGLHFVFLPGARGWHYVWRSFDAWQSMATAYGEADVELARTVHPHVLELAAREYHRRRWANRAVSALFAGRPMATAVISRLLGMLLPTLHAARQVKLTNGICSMIFNLRYYDGLARTLGGREAFLRLMSGEPVTALLEQLPECRLPDHQIVGAQ